MAARRPSTVGPVATYKVTFAQLHRTAIPAPAPPPPIPRLTRMLVLAHKIDGMINAGEIRDWADAARLVGVTRARMTQIGNLLLLSPSLQGAILDLSVGHNVGTRATERSLRQVARTPPWIHQRFQ